MKKYMYVVNKLFKRINKITKNIQFSSSLVAQIQHRLVCCGKICLKLHPDAAILLTKKLRNQNVPVKSGSEMFKIT